MQLNDGFLGRALMDPATGLPNVAYFSLIQTWEERRARRREYEVRVLIIQVDGGSERVRRSLAWRLCQELRTSDLIASNGPNEFRILLTTPDAENAEILCGRVVALAGTLNHDNPDGTPITMDVRVEAIRATNVQGPCEPCDESLLRDAVKGAERIPSPTRIFGEE